MTRRAEWEPILADDLRPSALEAISAIIPELCDINPDSLGPSTLCDAALLFAYQNMAEPSVELRDRSIAFLNTAIERVSSEPAIRDALYGGLSGVGWIIEHASAILADSKDRVDVNTAGDLEEDDAEDPTGDIDRALIRHLDRTPWTESYDLLTGLVGIGVYFLERLPRRPAREGIRLIIDRLEETSEQSWGGITWHTPPELILLSHERDAFPAGYYNLGVAHGVPGVVAFLAQVAGTRAEASRVLPVLNGAVQWIMAQERPPDALSRFSCFFAPGVEPSDSRLGWCYGDLGIACVLHHAARICGRADWRSYAISLFERCLTWPVDKDLIVDAPLCHGALGVAHICNRFYQAEAEPRYKEAANVWYKRGLMFRDAVLRTGEVFAFRPELSLSRIADHSFLSGAVGVALALISAAYPVAPGWDRLLLLSGRQPT